MGLQPAFCQNAGVNRSNPANRNHLSEIKNKESLYFSQLKIWCDALLDLQVKSGKDEGGIFSPASQFCLGRGGEVIYPFLGIYDLTGDKKYKTAAIKAYQWSERYVSQADGSWTNEAGGKNDWKGITVFRCIALGEALHYYSHLLLPTEKQQWEERLRKGADFILSGINFETGDINYPNSASAALAVCWKILGDEKYLLRAKEFAHFGLQHITVNNLMWGEGIRGINDTTAKGLRPIDIPYNITESLPNLALYATITGDKKAMASVIESFKAHLNFILPDGGMDAGWCSRQYKWTYYGSTTADGIAAGMALAASRDNRFLEAAHRNLALLKTYTHNGILYGGADYTNRGILPSAHHAIGNTKGLLTAIHANIKQGKKAVLPNDTAYGVREWKEASVIQIGIGPWRASVTTNDIASSKKRGGHPMGGALSMLWHKKTGPIAVASMNDYIKYEGSNMQTPKSDAENFCLTPRIEIKKDSSVYSNLYDGKATMNWVKNGDSVQVKIKGHLTDVHGTILANGETAFEMIYLFTPASFSMAVHSGAVGAKLLFPVLSPASEKIMQGVSNEIIIQKKSSRLKLTAGNMEIVNDKRVFNFVPGFEAVPLQIPLDKNGHGFIRIVLPDMSN
ncbi:MAG: hypothetical protein H7Z13_11245 [Ferruginibacter sp.]|nr:hypothetical protein [Ferruginibacter sp.]